MSGTIVNITAGSNFATTESPTFGGPASTAVAKPSKDYDYLSDGALPSGGTHGRNNIWGHPMDQP